MIITGKKFSKPEMSRVINGDVELAGEDAPVEKKRVDILAVEKYQSYNRSTLQKFIKSGYLTVDGVKVLKPNTLVSPEAKLDLRVPEEQKNADLDVPILFENEAVLVVNKPAGLLSTAKGEYCPEKTLEDYGLPAHRLDRETSGVVILAKDKETLGFLQNQFKERKAHKVYLAVVKGRPKLDFAKIDLPVERDLKKKTVFRVGASGKPAETYYEVLWTNAKYSLVGLWPKTGRTHQLRVHMSYIGNPIVGDVRYGGESGERLYLHAYSLEITIPDQGEHVRKTFKTDIPADLMGFLGLGDGGDILKKLGSPRRTREG